MPLSDTDPKAAEVQLELLRKAGPAKRFALMCSLSDMARGLARRAIERVHPGISPRDRDLLFLELHHGKELADKVRAYLEARER